MNKKNYRSRGKARVLLNLLSDPALIVDEKGGFLNVNSAFEEVTGLSRKELIGSPFSKLNILTEEVKATLSEILKKRMQGEPNKPYEVCFTGKAGETRYVEVKERKIRYAGQPAYLNVLRDITLRKENERRIKDYSEQMGALVEEKVKEIKENEEKFRAISTCARDAIIGVNSAGKIVYWNPAAEQIFGYSQVEAVGKNVLNLLVPQRNHSFQQNFLELIQVNKLIQREIIELIALRKDGTEFPAEMSVALMDFRGETYLLGIVRDASERKKAEEALRASEEKFRVYVESSPVAVFVANPEGRYEYVNDAACKLLGYSREELLEMSIPQVAFKQSYQVDLNSFVEVKETGRSLSETALKAKDGLPVYVILNSVKLPDGKLLAFCENITERKKAEEALCQSEELSRAIVANAPIGIATSDASYHFLSANEAFCRILGYSEDELRKLTNKEITHPEDIQGSIANMAALEARRTSFLIQEKRYIKKDGKVIVGRVIVNAIRNSKGEAVLFIAELEDITERKRSEEELRRAEEKFRTIFDGATDGILVADLKTRRFAYANPRICEITCYSLEELLKLGIDDIHPKKDLLYVIDQFTKQTQGKTTFAKDIPVLRKDEKVVYCDINSKPIRIEGQEYLVGFFRDITERKKAEEALRESEQRWATTLASIGDAVIATNLSGMVTFMNCVAEELTGWALSEALGKPVKEVFRIVNEQTRIEVEDPVSKVLERGLIAGLANHTVLIRKNGTEVAIDDSGAPIKDKEDKITGVVLVFHDITEARKVQDALMKSETQYRQLINVAQEGVWVLDSNYCTVFVNPRMAEMLGYAENEIVGKSIFEFLDKKDIEQAKQFFGQSKQGITTYFDYEFTRKNGSRIYASISTSVINDDEGNTLGTLAMVSDITYRKTLERKLKDYSKNLESMVELRTAQLKDANERLVKSERLAAIGELAGMVGHDLRNPLTGIKNAAYYLKKKGTTISEAQAKGMLEIIDKAIDHSNKIINDLLDYARDMHLELTECAPRTLVDEAMRMIQVPDRIQIVNHVLEETKVKVDADKIMRVFINLIKNAIEAMPEKGTLEIRSRQTRGNVEIAFADTGTGIPEETLPKIFSPLFTTKAQGMGFGLAICKRIIESHGGTITVKTAVNKGTTFTVTLPFKSKVEVGGEKTWINMPESLLSTMT